MNIYNKEFVVIIPEKDDESEQVQPDLPPQAPARPTEQDILRSASAQAESIVAQAQSSAEKIRQAAWQEGYREGRETAMGELNAMICAQAEDAKRVFDKLDAYGLQMQQQLLDSVLELSFVIAEKIINIHLKKDDRVYVEIAKKAIQALNASEKFALHVSRSEYERFFAEGGQWLQQEIGCPPFEVICDSDIEEGGSIVESDEGVVDASVNGQLAKLRRILERGAEPDETI
jgi:flagellar assembly protein FliH